MKFALVENERKEASPTLKGTCPICSTELVAKCGEIKVNHWAHKGTRICDHWWENETEWHRSWKDKFPRDWQEQVHHAEDGEKHIADVKTSRDWVIEFQYSFLNDEERRKRTSFYKKLAWVVSGVRRKRDKDQFFSCLKDSNPILSQPKIWKLFLSECVIVREWSRCSAPVFFDFGEPYPLFLLIQSNHEHWAFVTPFCRELFVNFHSPNDNADTQELSQLTNEYALCIDRFLAYQKAGNRHPQMTGFQQFQARQKRSRRF